MKKVLLLLLACLMACSFTASAESSSLTPLIDVVSCTYIENSFGYVVVIFENTGDVIVPYFDVQLLFKDDAGNIVGTEKDGHDAVLPHSQVVSRIGTNIKKNDFSSIEVMVDADKRTNNYQNHAASLEIKTNEGKDNVIAQITNGADVTIAEIEAVVVFFKMDDILGDIVVGAVENEETKVAPGGLIVMEFAVPYGENRDRIEYDMYRLYINQAHTW